MRKITLTVLFLLCVSMVFAANPTYMKEKPPAFEVGRYANSLLPSVTLESLKGEVVLVEFFRTSCPPCRAATAHLEKIYHSVSRPDFHILASTQDSYDLVRRFLYHHAQGVKINYPIAVECKAYWKVTGVPMAYIVGRDGKVVWAGNPNRDFKDALNNALAAPDPDAPEYDEKKAAKVMELMGTEAYSKVLREAGKIEKKGNAEYAKYLEEKIALYYARYMELAQKYIDKKDYHSALLYMDELKKKFKSTPYEEKIKGVMDPLKKDKEKKSEAKAWKQYHEILLAARTGKKGDVTNGVKALTSFAEDNANYSVAEEAKEMIKILKNPWTQQEALGR